MNFGRSLAIARRILKQLSHDHRTAALIIVVPLVLLSIIGALFKTNQIFNIGIVNQDQGVSTPVAQLNFGSKIASSLKNSSNLNWEKENLDQANSDLKDGRLDAYILLDSSLSEQYLAGQVPSFSIKLEGSDPNATQQVLGLVTKSVSESFSGSSLPALSVSYLYGGKDFDSLDYFAPVFIAFFAFMFVFLLTCVSFLRERTQGTIERLFASPVNNTEIVLGYFLGFLFFALLQSLVVLLFTIYVLKVHFLGNLWAVFLLEFVLVTGAVNLGIFLSTFARNELQVIQFIPLVVVSQGLLSGLIWPVSSMPALLRWISYAMPLSYANHALRAVMIQGKNLAAISVDIYVLIAFAILMVVLASVSIRQSV